MLRRHLLASGIAVAFLPLWVTAQSLEKTKVTLAVGGKNLLYYLPLTIAEQLGYFKAEGLDVTIVDFAGGSKALQAVVGGSADVVSGAFEHTVNMQFKGQPLRAFVLQGAAPQDHCRPQRQENWRVGARQFHQRDGQLCTGQGRPQAQ
jgi:NitT/TauT family transport system substrate-binding protein